jgi:hypothetical protein
MDDTRVVFRVLAAYVLATGAFWVLFLLNRTYHWLSMRHFVALSIAMGAAMCLAAASVALIKRRTSD